MNDLFTKDHWRDVGQKLRFGAKRWWEAHRDELVDLGKDEARDVFRQLRRGDRRAAKLEIVSRMTPEQWAAYRDGTTAQLQDIAARRAKLLAALEELGWFAARTIGTAALAAL
jgi:hypothetical protein